MNKLKFDFNDVVIKPEVLSTIESRSEIILNQLPLFVAPMDTVVDNNNVSIFLDMGYQIAYPRNERLEYKYKKDVFLSVGLAEAELMLKDKDFPEKLLIDIANGHMLKLYNIAQEIKMKHPEVVLMIGNVANPETYKEYCKIGVDYVRVGIGGGSACTTSANTGVHYPMASLIEECNEYKKRLDSNTKIVADGGFRQFDEIIKAIALGADCVMVGGILSKSLESCSTSFHYEEKYNIYTEIDDEKALKDFEMGKDIYKQYRGMSTKEVQAKWNKDNLKTAEGISFYNKVEYKLDSWTENFIDYLKSAMSYTGKRTLEEFTGNVDLVQITSSAQERYRK
jgi:IMP dehydrogenase/GMP reductase